ncbi:NAD(P)H-binding protein [Microbacterium sp. zg-Y818]|uniref:NAD(P)H-binding protein n=1 Tax=unclassified Microbacterium TaxID=2609290 RepID=UPI00214AE940|nr:MULTISPECIES: NAD(P)H-binding protein [unclassified Microbacterium]MCR2799461.1 NAD(P)H-binding protein [Microbacterium sp. zg.Y818]WIM21458.1 NAD(P)H-binding protein [Microbacterium sp. zg-Y818]
MSHVVFDEGSMGMKVFIIGVSGAVGGLLARELRDRGDEVSGLVRREQQRTELAARGVDARVGDLASMKPDAMASLLTGMDAVVYTAGSNAGARPDTVAIDGEGVVTALEAVSLAGVRRFALVSVLPEAGRGQNLSADEEFYYAVKKLVDVTVSMSDVDWLILRPSMLVDDPANGTVALGPAQPHDEIPREDVATTLAELLHEPGISRQILELTQGATPIAQAVRAARPRAVCSGF